MVVYRWNEPEALPGAAPDLTESGLLSRILYRRGIRSPAEAAAFLSPSLEQLNDPSLLPDAQRALALFRRAVSEGWRVVVFGDYDADGITATAILTRLFRSLGLRVQPMIPHRIQDGYGFHPADVPAVLATGARLLVTVDCGTASAAALADVQRAGVSAVVLDHHAVDGYRLPLDVAFVSPQRDDSRYPFRHLAAVGVTYQMARLLLGDDAAQEFLPLVALGTVCDVVPLRGDNRVLVAEGLRRFGTAVPLGLRALVDEVGLRLEQVTSWHCGFVLGPRINAAGRMDDPMVALQLLLTEDWQEARRLARRLSALNERRQREIERMVAEAEQRLRGHTELPPVLVLADEAWNVGLVGLAASKLASRYVRPVVVLSRRNGISRGSVRGIAGFDVSQALAACRDVLLEHGGHSAAGGLTLHDERIVELQARLLDYANATLRDDDFVPVLDLDAELDPAGLSVETLRLVSRLEPFGHGNPTPRFFMRGVRVRDLRHSRNERHLLFTVVPVQGRPVSAVWFDGGEYRGRLEQCPIVDIAFSLRADTWNGHTDVKLDVIDVRPATTPPARSPGPATRLDAR